MTACKVNLSLLPLKTTYFFILSGLSSLFPYLSVYMRNLGLSPRETSIIFGVMPFISALFRPPVGALADKFAIHKQIAIICMLSTGLFHALLLLVPSAQSEDIVTRATTIGCSNDSLYFTSCVDPSSTDVSQESPIPDMFNCSFQCISQKGELNYRLSVREMALVNSSATLELECSKYVANGGYLVSTTDNNTHISTCSESEILRCEGFCEEPQRWPSIWNYSPTFGKTFWMFFIIYTLAQLAFAPVFGMADGIVYSHLGSERHRWGEQRVWGTVGYALTGVTVSLVIDDSYAPCFIGCAVGFTLAAINIFFFKKKDQKAEGIMENLCAILSRFAVTSLLILVFSCGLMFGIIETFLFWHLQNIGGSQFLLGLCIFVDAAGEIPMLLAAGYIIKRIGQVRCLYLSLLVYAIRMAGYGFLYNPWLVLLIEPLHSFCYGLMYSAASSLASMVTPQGMHCTVQNLITALHFGFGKGVGSLVGGELYELFGIRITFQITAIFAAFILLWYYLAQVYMHKRGTGQFIAIDAVSDDSAEDDIIVEKDEKQSLLGDSDKTANKYTA